ncbi:tyrosine phosphatase [Acrasis kona]|uniref:protein-tyrosine-phosphatase n=1 Tax=Acrasis kona TaxID=1008807 RepID=A0AAW2ZQG5_9EUKA
MEIFEHVYLGNRHDASNASLLKLLRIGHVLNVTDDLKNYFHKMNEVEQKVVRRIAGDNETGSETITLNSQEDDASIVLEGLGLGVPSRHPQEEIGIEFDQEDGPSDVLPTNLTSPEKKMSDNSLSQINTELVKFDRIIEYKRISIVDSMEHDIKRFFPEGIEFISSAVAQNSNVIIHCREGRSRSVSLLIAYAMNKLGWSLKQTFDHVQTLTNNHTRINDGFKRQLMEYEIELMMSRRAVANVEGVANIDETEVL